MKSREKKHRQQYDARKMLVTLKINTRVAFNYRLPHHACIDVAFFSLCSYDEYQWEYMVLLYGLYTSNVYGDMCACFYIRTLQSQSWYYLNFSFMFCVCCFSYCSHNVSIVIASAASFVDVARVCYMRLFFSTHTRTESRKNMLMDPVWLYVSIGFFK